MINSDIEYKYIYGGRIFAMAGYRVEICGVNTAKLPLLKGEEKEGETLSKGIKESPAWVQWKKKEL